ncbi:hypothetical protein K1T71_002855 [Dendrolimus kikuchii]|uniref:Uncharacterized protein n=1 Tax=Dendrolimus kikuchii TaxID=765133 RepID=A0ACC1DDW0_9NEOP|nr:hypothetical protein K1T71_002855 [Dendrolimus kikuchii]
MVSCDIELQRLCDGCNYLSKSESENVIIIYINNLESYIGPCGLMDKASDFGSEDCRFESCHGRVPKYFFL